MGQQDNHQPMPYQANSCNGVMRVPERAAESTTSLAGAPDYYPGATLKSHRLTRSIL